MTSPSPRRLLLLAAGFSLWASAFVMLYSVNAVGCAFSWPHPLQRGLLLTLLAVHLAALGGLLRHCWQPWRAIRAQGFLENIALGVTVAALAATLLTFAPSLVLTLCD